MIEIKLGDYKNKQQVNEFIQFPFDLYKGDPNWVPPFRNDIEVMLNKKKHPFYEHSQSDFFLAYKDGKLVGRISALNNVSYNNYHHTNTGNFFFFDSIDDQEVANALFNKASEWIKQYGREKLVGPKGYSLFDGYGVLVEGFEWRQMINMEAYNYPYYQKLYENYGFTKVNEFVSMNLPVAQFSLPEKVHKVAEIVKKRGTLRVFSYKNRLQFLKNAKMIASLYMTSFENNWEYFPITSGEMNFLVKNVFLFLEPRMVKFIATPENEIVGILVTFPDISGAMQKHNGKITPGLVIDILRATNKTNRAAINGMGIIEKYHGRGGDALLFCALEDVLKENPQFISAEAVQMAESAKEIRIEMETLGLKTIKRHRVYEHNLV